MSIAWNIREKSLYILATNAVVKYFHKLRKCLDKLPQPIVFDITYQSYLRISNVNMRTDFRLKIDLLNKLTDFPTFVKFLKVGDKRSGLHKMLQAAVEVPGPVKWSKLAPDTLAKAFCRNQEEHLAELTSTGHEVKLSDISKGLMLGLNLGEFLCEAGWYTAASEVHRACVNIIRSVRASESGLMLVKLDCLTSLLLTLTNDCQPFSEAENIHTELISYIRDEELTTSTCPNLAYSCSVLSKYHSMNYNFDLASTWAMESVKLLTPILPPKLTLDVLRQASIVCVRKREFAKAEILVKQALGISKTVFGDTHVKYADSLIDYGFYLLNVDRLTASVEVYQKALKVRETIFGGDNLKVAWVCRALAGAEFSCRAFSDARRHAEKSLSIMERHLPANHLYVAFSKRVLALVLLEVAISPKDEILLKESEELHKFVFNIIRHNFGEYNLQTALCYANLGRFYKRTHKFEESEKIYLRAIEILEEIHGTEDSQVANCLYGLAIVYFCMNQHLKAEKLFLRSIDIFQNVCGPTYSRLEYSYMGLIQVYQKLPDHNKFQEYRSILVEWRILRDEAEQSDEVSEDGHKLPLSELIKAVTATSKE